MTLGFLSKKEEDMVSGVMRIGNVYLPDSPRQRFQLFKYRYRSNGNNLKRTCKALQVSPHELFASFPTVYRIELLNLRLKAVKSLDKVCREFEEDPGEVKRMAEEAGYKREKGLFKRKNPLTPADLLKICEMQQREDFTDEELIQACLLLTSEQQASLRKDGQDLYASLSRDPEGPPAFAIHDPDSGDTTVVNSHYVSSYRYRKGSRRDLNHYAGCLLGGAIGDALGYPVEFASRSEIEKRYGTNGIEELEISPNGKALISDDTQMTLFTAEGLLRAVSRGMQRGICHPPGVIYYSYLRWLHTQGELMTYDKERREFLLSGWWVTLPELKARRASGTTCLNALRSGRMGSVNEPINKSKGCGGVMRVAPVGLLTDFEDPFELACEVAAITHGHPTGYLAAGVLAQIIRNIIDGDELIPSIEKAVLRLKEHKGHEECLLAVERALELYRKGDFSVQAVQSLGEGWVAEEALAISLFCSLAAGNDFAAGVKMAVNHSGDSDSTGAITGNILGALLGYQAIPKDWAEKVELSCEIIEMANDLLVEFSFDVAWAYKYPGG